MLKALEEIQLCFRSYLPIKGSSLVSVSHLVLYSTLGSGVLTHTSGEEAEAQKSQVTGPRTRGIGSSGEEHGFP